MVPPPSQAAFINLLAVKGYPKNEAQTPFEFSITNAYLANKYGRKK